MHTIITCTSNFLQSFVSFSTCLNWKYSWAFDVETSFSDIVNKCMAFWSLKIFTYLKVVIAIVIMAWMCAFIANSFTYFIYCSSCVTWLPIGLLGNHLPPKLVCFRTLNSPISFVSILVTNLHFIIENGSGDDFFQLLSWIKPPQGLWYLLTLNNNECKKKRENLLKFF